MQYSRCYQCAYSPCILSFTNISQLAFVLSGCRNSKGSIQRGRYLKLSLYNVSCYCIGGCNLADHERFREKRFEDRDYASISLVTSLTNGKIQILNEEKGVDHWYNYVYFVFSGSRIYYIEMPWRIST